MLPHSFLAAQARHLHRCACCALYHSLVRILMRV